MKEKAGTGRHMKENACPLRTMKGRIKASVQELGDGRHLADAWLVLFFLPFIGQAIFVSILCYLLGKDRAADRSSR